MFWKGPVFTKDGFRNQTINLEDCEITEGFEGGADGIIIPLLRNCHTHLGDTLARNKIPENLTLEELTEDTCKYMEGNPNEKDARFCGRKKEEKFADLFFDGENIPFEDNYFDFIIFI